ncbi:MAG: hypothetical protein K9G46_07745 [Flavobacteriales bacterium]|nr:hypothetical protein [Flavobacteriales bacterium]
MISLEEIDLHVRKLIAFLESIQNADGSFNTYYMQPHYNPDKEWMKFPGNAPYDTATTVLPLLKIDSPNAKSIIGKANEFLLQQSLDSLLWTYAFVNDDYWIPYDTDSTSLASLVLTESGHKVENKVFLDSLIGKDQYYPFYIWPDQYRFNIPFITYCKMVVRNWRVKRCIPIVNDDMRVTDSEFSSSCLNLLYLGKTDANSVVWEKLKKTFASQSVDHMYYLDFYHSFYHVTRLAYFTGNNEIVQDERLIEEYISQLKVNLNNISQSDRQILLANALLFLDGEKDYLNNLSDVILARLNEECYNQTFAIYSSNVNTDYQPDGKSPNTYFGSPAITCSLYLEFLNMYRYRFHGGYYSSIG